jgi:formylglycine-generating enzyme required for sulfatase activity
LQPDATGQSTYYSFSDGLKTGTKGPEMVVIPEGSFIMGDQQGNGKSNELAHEVRISQAYAIGKFEITLGEFKEFVENTGYVTSAEKGQGCYTFSKARTWNWIQRADWRQPNFKQADSHPVVCVSWHDAVTYTQWLSKQTGQLYRLPTEAEWEYVARAGTNTNFWWGNENDMCNSANCCLGQNWVEKQTRAVGSYQANTFGVHDTAGNVWEWTASNYVEQFSGDENRVAGLTENDTMKTMRGGSWYSFPSDTRSSTRAKNWPQERHSTIGFRVVRAVTPDLVNVALDSNNQ